MSDNGRVVPLRAKVLRTSAYLVGLGVCAVIIPYIIDKTNVSVVFAVCWICVLLGDGQT